MSTENSLRAIIASKSLFDTTYKAYLNRCCQCWRYKFQNGYNNKITRTDTTSTSIVRTAVDAYSSFLFSQSLESIKVVHANDAEGQKKFLSLAKRFGLMDAIKEIIHSIINFDSVVIHLEFNKAKKHVFLRNIRPDNYVFARIDGKITPIIYSNEHCYYPLDGGGLTKAEMKDFKTDIKFINHKYKNSIGIVERDAAFVYKATSHYSNNMMSCRAFSAMGIEDEIVEYKTALETLVSFNSYPTLLVDSNSMIRASTLQPGQVIPFTPSANAPGLPPLRRAVPDTINLADETIKYIEYLKRQLNDLYMLDIILKDDSSSSTTAVATIISDIYAAVTDLVEKFLTIMVTFGYFREFNKDKNIDTLNVDYHSRATQGSKTTQYNNIVQSLELMIKLHQIDPSVMKNLDIHNLISVMTRTLGTSDAVALQEK